MFNLAQILKSLEFLSWIVAAMAVSYAGYFFLSEMKDFNVQVAPVAVKKNVNDSSAAEIPALEIKPYDFYEQQITTRDIFSSYSVSSAGSTQPQVISGQLPANLKVVGIVLGEKPQIIIEDTTSQQTYFIDKGSSQAGIQIDHVQDNTIFLNYSGQIIGVDLKGSNINLNPTSANP